MVRTKLIWVPNMFTGLRLVLAVPIVIAAMQAEWTWGFWLIIAALLTDFADGLAAKKLNAYTKLGEYLDPLADFSLAAAGILGIILSGHLSVWVGLVMLVPAIYVGYVKFLLQDEKVRIMQPMFSVPYLFVVWAFIAWVYASNAYGWAWWYVPLTLVILIAAAIPKRHRLRAWFRWIIDKRNYPA